MSLVGTTVGRLRIVEKLGKGGMGDVYAGYDETLKRRVALKAIRAERRLDEETKARFLREARMLSRLDHPGICRIHEYIEGDDSDFLVLELIEGRTLRQALGEELDPAFRLHIAERVAEALVAAHAEGITHRDLKPENVMITDEGAVKVLDFGLAYTVERPRDADQTGDPASSATSPPDVGEPPSDDISGVTIAGQRIARAADKPISATVEMSRASQDGVHSRTETETKTEPELLTRAGVVVGTVAYMSPEQALGERASVAGDIYSLGLMMQELFTGRSAYSSDKPLLQMLAQVARGETQPVTGIDPDLAELITRMKSLDPGERPTAAEIVERLRWIRGKAGRRLLRRIAGVLVAVLFLGGIKYTFDLRAERRLADEARHEAEEVSEFLVGLFEVADPDRTRGEDITVTDLLTRGADRIAELDDQPMSQARLMLTMGRVSRRLGLYERAAPLLERTLEIYRQRLGDEHLETARCQDLLANVYHDRGDYGRATPLFESSLSIREQQLGEAHPHVAASLNNLAFLYQTLGRFTDAEPLLLRSLEIQESVAGSGSAEVAWSLNNLGELYRNQGELERAELFLRRSMEIQEQRLGSDHPSLAAALNNLAAVAHDRGQPERAETLYRRALEIAEKVLGTEHPNVATSLNNLAEHYRVVGDYPAAEPLYERGLAILETALGSGHPSVAVLLSNLADLHSARGDLGRAEPLYERAIAIQEEALGSDDTGLAVTLEHLAGLRHAAGDHADAEVLYRRALAIQEAVLGGEHPDIVLTRTDFAALLVDLERLDEAESLLVRSGQTLVAALDERPRDRRYRSRFAAVDFGLGELHRARGDEESAVEYWQRSLETLTDLTTVTPTVSDLHIEALALSRLGRDDEAQALATELRARGWRHPDFVAVFGHPDFVAVFGHPDFVASATRIS